jgi:hypothetical protein
MSSDGRRIAHEIHQPSSESFVADSREHERASNKTEGVPASWPSAFSVPPFT